MINAILCVQPTIYLCNIFVNLCITRTLCNIFVSDVPLCLYNCIMVCEIVSTVGSRIGGKLFFINP